MDITKLLNAKIQSPSYVSKTPTKELLFTDNGNISSTSLPVPIINTPNGNILNNDRLLLDKNTSFVPLINNIETPLLNVNDKIKSKTLSCNKETDFINKSLFETTSVEEILKEMENSYNRCKNNNENATYISDKIPFKSTRLVTQKERHNISQQDQNNPTPVSRQFKSVQLISSESSTSVKKEESLAKVDTSNKNKTISQEADINTSEQKEEVKTDKTDIKKVSKATHKKIKKKTVLIIGDSMLNGIEESKLSKTRHIRVQPIPGATVEDIQENIIELLNEDLQTVIIHAGTNNSVTDSPQCIVDKLLTLKHTINSHLPKCQVIISSLIKRTDNSKAHSTNRNTNKLIKELNIQYIENENIEEKHLGKKGLHLNQEGNVLFARNLLHKIRNI